MDNILIKIYQEKLEEGSLIILHKLKGKIIFLKFIEYKERGILFFGNSIYNITQDVNIKNKLMDDDIYFLSNDEVYKNLSNVVKDIPENISNNLIKKYKIKNILNKI